MAASGKIIRSAVALIVIALLLTACNTGVVREPEQPPISEPGFMVYFIDVGQADSALVICDGAAMLIDGGNVADSDLLYAFLKDHSVSHLDYIVATHAHEDHVGGLVGALEYATAGVALAPVADSDNVPFKSFIIRLNKQGVKITIPGHGDSFKLGSSDVFILGPINQYDSVNNTSIVLKIMYGETGFLFTGDAERESEADILDMGYELSATVLKVGHHGSYTSTTYPFLREVMPQYAVISCGDGNMYGYPHEETLSKLRDADATVFRTDMQGTITCASDGKAVTMSAERNADAITNPTQPSVSVVEDYYIGNVNTLNFHRPSCTGLPAEKNRIIFDTREEAVESGFSPCNNCLGK